MVMERQTIVIKVMLEMTMLTKDMSMKRTMMTSMK